MKNLRTILAEEGVRRAYDERQLERDLDKLVSKFFAERGYHAELDDASEAIQIFIDSLGQLSDMAREKEEGRKRAKSKTAGDADKLEKAINGWLTPKVTVSQVRGSTFVIKRVHPSMVAEVGEEVDDFGGSISHELSSKENVGYKDVYVNL